MGQIRIDFTFDYVDPGSYLVHRLLVRWAEEESTAVDVQWIPLELRTPAAERLDPAEPRWAALTEEMERIAREERIPFSKPLGVPRTRKAHELALHAREQGRFGEVHDALFDAHFVRGIDIGRVDALVELAAELGLPAAETRTVLGVDRFAAEVERIRREAIRSGVRGVPTLEAYGERLAGLASVPALRAFIGNVATAARVRS